MSKKKPPLCVLCRDELEDGYYVRRPGKPVTYLGGFICNNNSCPRYGLLSILKGIGTGV